MYAYGMYRAMEIYSLNNNSHVGLSDFVLGLVWVAPGAMVGIGAYLHAASQKPWGFWLLISGAVVNNLVIVLLNGERMHEIVSPARDVTIP